MKTRKIRNKTQAMSYGSVELYSEERVREFVQTNTIPVALQQRVDALVKKKHPKR